MKVVIDIECNGLHNPTHIWVIVCKDIDSGAVRVFREVTKDAQAKEAFLEYASSVDHWVGHNFLEYDYPVLNRLLGFHIPDVDIHCTDTLILSRLTNYSRAGGHSIEQYGEEFGLPKLDIGKSVAGHNPFFNQWSELMEVYCGRDVEICNRVYNLLGRIDPVLVGYNPLRLEQRFQLVANDLHSNGFGFDTVGADALHAEVTKELSKLDEKILKAFPPRRVLIRTFTPKATKFGTINKSSVPRALHADIHTFEVGNTYEHTRMEAFNPASHKQLIGVLNEAGWKPEEKTQTHVETERQASLLARGRRTNGDVLSLRDCRDKLEKLKISGWKINEINLNTLPKTAPVPARLLARRILLESRRRTLTEWLALVQEDGRIHGEFKGMGAWTHRMAHQKPNTANIPSELNLDGSQKLFGKEMRSLWCAPKRRLLVGVDAEGIQLRIFAHYINDEEFTNALVKGRKSNKTDPHSLNQVLLGSVCKTRAAAKRFVYALLLGGGLGKLSVILGCSTSDAKEALNRLLERYTGFARMRNQTIPSDARRGYFIGIDGRKVVLPGDTQRDREHLCMSGYLQNGEAIVIKRAAIIAEELLKEEKRAGKWLFVDIVHDELQSEVKNSLDFALKVAKIKAEAIVQAGKEYNLRCPMAGSYYNEDHKDYTIGKNWSITH